jgi:multiple sugar transport system substrate-binding protein
MSKRLVQGNTVTRRTFLGSVTASAAAAILAACGGSNAADTPKPAAATTGAPTTAGGAATTVTGAGTAAATKPAGSAPAASTTTTGSAVAGGAPTTAAAASGPIGTITPPPADKFKGQKITMLSRQEYFSGTQQQFDIELDKIKKQLNIETDNSHVNLDQGDVVTRQDSAVKAGNVQDTAYVTGFVSQWHTLDDIVDVTDVVEELQKSYGPVEDGVKEQLFLDGKWYGVPYFANATGMFARKDWFAEKGIKIEDLKTFENWRDIALQLSDPSKNRYGWGSTWNRSGDGNYLIQSCLFNYGANFVSNDGKKVVFNSPETVAAITFLSDVFTNAKYKNMLPPGINSWTDPSNNEAWLAGTLGITQNGYTLYAQSFRDKNPVYGNTAVLGGVSGPGSDRVIAWPGYGTFVIFKGAKNVPLAKEIAKQMVGGQALLNFAKPSIGLILPAYKKLWDSDPFYTTGDPSLPALRKIIEADKLTSKTGYTFPLSPSPGSDAVLSQYVLPDMMGDIILKGAKVPDAVKAAHDRMVLIFEQLGLKQ